MPYKFEKDKVKLTLSQNKRIKLSPAKKQKIKVEYEQGNISMRELARKYGVSKRSIQFSVYPEKRSLVSENERGKSIISSGDLSTFPQFFPQLLAILVVATITEICYTTTQLI